MRKISRFIVALLVASILTAIPAAALGASEEDAALNDNFSMRPVTKLTQILPSKSFKDVASGAWYYGNMDSLVRAGGIDGFADGTFRPDSGLKLGEFIKIVVSIMYPDQLDPWADYMIDGAVRWQSPYVGAAAYVGLLDESEMTFAKLEDAVNRYTMAKVMYNASILMGSPLLSSEYAYCFIGDYSKIPYTYRDYVLAAYTAGILTGKDAEGNFFGSDGLKRSEACAAIVRLFDQSARSNIVYDGITDDEFVIALKYPEYWEVQVGIADQTDSYGNYWMHFVNINCDDKHGGGLLCSIVLCPVKMSIPSAVYVGYEGAHVYFYRPADPRADYACPQNDPEYAQMEKDITDGRFGFYIKHFG